MMKTINPTPLRGIILAGYAKANADSGLTVAAKKCGYGSDITRFVDALQQACINLNIKNKTLSTLMTEKSQIREVPPTELGTGALLI